MDITIIPQELSGTIEAISSKSVAHRLLISAAFCTHTTDIDCVCTSEDIDATKNALCSLGAQITKTQKGFRVLPVPHDLENTGKFKPIQNSEIDCAESGSTLRFILPCVAALGCNAKITVGKSLENRPITSLYNELICAGVNLSEEGVWPLEVSGQLRPGHFLLPGNISSQYITGLLLAAPLMDGDTYIQVLHPYESRAYVDLTISAMAEFGVEVISTDVLRDDQNTTVYIVKKDQTYKTCRQVSCEGDWSNAAFWLGAGAISNNKVSVLGLDMKSLQADRAYLGALSVMGVKVRRKPDQVSTETSKLRSTTICCKDFPDLVPPIAAVAAYINGTTILTGLSRLQYKESNRIETVVETLRAMGVIARASEDKIIINGTGKVFGGVVDSHNDHRIAMMASIMATKAEGPTTILGAQCTAKSYPGFYDDFRKLGGKLDS